VSPRVSDAIDGRRVGRRRTCAARFPWWSFLTITSDFAITTRLFAPDRTIAPTVFSQQMKSRRSTGDRHGFASVRPDEASSLDLHAHEFFASTKNVVVA